MPYIHRRRLVPVVALATAAALSGCSVDMSTGEPPAAATSPATIATTGTPASAGVTGSTPPALVAGAAFMVNNRPLPQMVMRAGLAAPATYATVKPGQPVTVSMADGPRSALPQGVTELVDHYTVTSSAVTPAECRFDVQVAYTPGGDQKIAAVAHTAATQPHAAVAIPNNSPYHSIDGTADTEVAALLGIAPPYDTFNLHVVQGPVTSTTPIPVGSDDTEGLLAIAAASDYSSYAITEACDGSSFAAPADLIDDNPTASKNISFPLSDGTVQATVTVQRGTADGTSYVYGSLSKKD